VNQGVQVFAIGYQETLVSCTSWRNAYGLTHPVLRDATGSVSVLYIPNQGGYLYFPHNAIVDQNHILRYSTTAFNESAMRATLDGLMVPQIAVSPNQLNFGTTNQGSSVSRTFLIDNTGSGIVSVSSMAPSNPSFHISPSTGQVYAYNDSLTVTVTFTPSQARLYTDSLQVISTGGNAIIGLSGTGTAVSVHNLVVRRMQQHITLTWTAVPGVWRYYVYQGSTPDVAPIASNFRASVSNPSFLDANILSLTGPRARFYCVTAVFQP
jgi:hypothetical protein